ncbi:tachykinin-like peptides receptor 99D [Diabrotica undecimpunctata]|uniref:tachykinin-like peptides receptor 99D n=1 Tax=Diabrotica undecimpunctata TaxID=50387 RepID=UPI003B63D6A8
MNSTIPECVDSVICKCNFSFNSSFSPAVQFILPLWRQIFWCAFYAVMVITAIGGNVIVIWIIWTNKRMRTVTNYFLLNLSVADTMVSTFNVTFNFVYMLHATWPFGLVYCKITQFMAVSTVCASVFSLMAISIDRYMAIIVPLRRRMSKKCTLIIILCTWMLAVVFAMPQLLVFQVDIIPCTDRISCYSLWPDGNTNSSNLEYIYNISFIVFTYFIPVGAMIITYSQVAAELWWSKSIGEVTDRQMEIITNKRKVVKMMIVVVTIFAVCWSPYQIYFLLTFYYPSITLAPYVQEVYLFIYWLAMSNSMYNPIIYCWMNARFRRGFKQVFSFLPFVTVDSSKSPSRSERIYTQESYYGRKLQRNNTLTTQMTF